MNLSEINIYPIKSLGGISLDKSVVEKRGLQFDRRWMLVDEKNQFLTQRELPKMATISLELTKKDLSVSAKNFENLLIPYKPHGDKKIEVRIWQNFCEAILLEKKFNDWFSAVLQTNCRLVYMPDETERAVNPLFNKNNDIVSFADGYPFLVIGENSLDNLNEKLENSIPINRFRPNFVVKNSAPFAEDNWKKLQIGGTVFRATKPCERCIIPTIDQTEGFFTGKEPLKTLADYRLAKDVFPNNFSSFGLNKNSVLFGQNLVAESFGETVKIGDEIKILA
ncbi:MOSC domain-containing protein [soil metagenome]